MMGLRVTVALLLLSLQHAEVDSVPSDHALKTEVAESSHHHQRRSSVWGLVVKTFKREKNNEVRSSDYIKWETSFSPKNGVNFIDDNNNEFYIAVDKDCKPCAYDSAKSKCASSTADKFLVNVDDFEILEWKPILKGKIPPLAVETCKGYFITKHNNALGYLKEKSWTVKPKDIEVLSLNDIKEEILTNVRFDPQLRQTNKRPALFNKLTVVNNNCQTMKQQVKMDSGFEETDSFQIGKTVLIGGTVGFKKIVEASVKADFGGSETETKSNIKKKANGYTQEIEIPKASSCFIDIRSEVSVTVVPFTADVTRVYEDDNIRTTSISGNYTYQDSTEMKTDFRSCRKLVTVFCPTPKQ